MNLTDLDKQVNDLILSGKAMEAFEAYYSDDVQMQENSEAPRVGKAACRKYEEDFFAMLEAWHGATVLSTGAGGDKTFAEWHVDFSLKGMGRMTYTQVAVRTWKNGKIVHERFYYTR